MFLKLNNCLDERSQLKFKGHQIWLGVSEFMFVLKKKTKKNNSNVKTYFCPSVLIGQSDTETRPMPRKCLTL